MIMALMMVVLLPLLSTCGNGSDTKQTETDAVTDDKAYTIIENAVARYTIVYPQGADEELRDMAQKLKNDLNRLTGVTFSIKTDRVAQDGQNTDGYEILIGSTNRPESAEALKKLRAKDFSVEKINNKLVLAAHDNTGIYKAINHFITTINKHVKQSPTGECETLMLTADDFMTSRAKYDYDKMTISGNSIDSYVIVYPRMASEAEKLLADNLQAYIKKTTGYIIPCASDDAQTQDYEILVGNTNRAESKPFYSGETALSRDEYALRCTAGKLVVAYGGWYSSVVESETFSKYFQVSDDKSQLSIDEGFSMKTTNTLFGDANRLADEANLRIMSFNILSEEWDDKIPLNERKLYFAATLLHYAPDVIGLQEVSLKWYSTLPNLISSDYELVCIKNAKDEYNYYGMAYNKNKVKLLESGTDIYSAGNSTRIRLVTWGYFEKLDSGKRFLVMNTHWCIYQDNRIVEASEMAALYNQYKARFGCPIITTGDYNANQNSREYQDFVSKTSVLSARINALEKTGWFAPSTLWEISHPQIMMPLLTTFFTQRISPVCFIMS